MKISVALSTYNGEKYIIEQIKSILYQTKKIDELVISDDASKDNTVKVIEEYLSNKDCAYLILKHKENQGVSKNFWEAISNCHGDIIFTCDQDDVWKENKVEDTVEVFNNPDVVLAFSDADIVDSDLKSLDKSLWSTLKVETIESEKDLFELLLNHNVITGATTAFRKSMFDSLEPVLDNWLHDEWIAICSFAYGSIAKINKKLILYRQHENNVVGAKEIGIKSKINKYIKNAKSINSNRINKYNFYVSVLKSCKWKNKEYSAQLENCVLFWECLINVSKGNFIRRLIWISNSILNGSYNKYYTGIRGAIRDMFYKVESNDD